MLQVIKKTYIYLFLLFFVAVAYATPKDTGVNWVLEDAFKEEFLPLREATITLPLQIRTALEYYHSGKFREAAQILEKYRDLNLPDGRLDFIAFALAECYRQMRVVDKASSNYLFIINRFSSSDKVAPSFYRLLEYASNNRDIEKADSIHTVFLTRFKHNPLFNSVLYTVGTLYFRENRIGEAVQLLTQISKNSSRYLQAQFVSALCYVNMKEYQKPLLILDFVRRNTKDVELTAEANIVIGDIYYHQNNIQAAYQNYKNVAKNARRYQYALVKTARSCLDLKNFGQARDMARNFIRTQKNSEYFFEMASILEQAYNKLGSEKDAARVNGMIHRQVVDARLSFEVFEEVDRLTDVKKGWQSIEYEAIRTGNAALLKASLDKIEKIRSLELQFRTLLSSLNNSQQNKNKKDEVPHLAERRYLSLLKKQMVQIDDSTHNVKGKFELAVILSKKKPNDTLLIRQADTLSKDLDSIRAERLKAEREYAIVVKECLGGNREERQVEEEMQAKFVDWAFSKYIDKKDELKKMSMELSEHSKNKNSKNDSLNKAGKAVVQKSSDIDREKLNRSIHEDRVRLISHIQTMLEVYPDNRYNAQILFRIAELDYDQAGDDFQIKLREYERKLAEGKDTAALQFPEFNLDKVILIYDQIIDNYPKDELADNALFYKALALQKLGGEEESNAVLEDLVQKYPESEFFVEANMNIGKYYFDHPKLDDGQGYKIAEEAYRKVLYYRDHPEFVQALYHLGWCYYMQDRYEEAIAVFKYLVEEVDLDFDPSKMDEKQIVNPLLRGEAIDYIAISFDEEGRVDDAIKFLELIGNIDYSAMVLKRIGELREEDLDYDAAIRIYRRLLKEYPTSLVTPDASVSLIKLLDSREKSDSAMIQREAFFEQYSAGRDWQKSVLKKDTTITKRIDSMAISIGLYVADANYRTAEKTKNPEDYKRAVVNYKKLVKTYPKSEKSAEARWNLAVILDNKLNDKAQAFAEYIASSRLMQMDSTQREQAALNAIAIAQQLLPPDSSVQKGNVDFAASKVLEAVNNYVKLFPTGKATSQVLLSMGAIYYNRHMYLKAIEVYNRVVALDKLDKDFYEAMLLIGQCYFGDENWPNSTIAFSKVWKEAKDESQKAAAYKLLLQSEFLYAKDVLKAGDYERAAETFRKIEENYPGSEYGDIVLFNSAEAFEKKELWIKATDSYYDLYKKYPQSKLVPDALFNAAGDFEKSDKFAKAAEIYEVLVNQYGSAEKAKDALFNLGFCYEKLGKLDKMAETNERYSQLYPGEKDVEIMLLRSAGYYMHAAMYDRAISVYRNFVRRFPTSTKSIEAMFMVAKCFYEQKDMDNALLSFNQAEQQNLQFAQSKMPTNNYFAAEAVFYTGEIRRERFQDIKLILPEAQIKKSLKEKSDLLLEASKSYQRVMQYQSERMFEAAYRLGQMYEELALAWKNQDRPQLDPINEALLNKEILTGASNLLQKSFIPYKKAMQLSDEFDSLGNDQRMWVQKSKLSLAQNYLTTGNLLFNAIGAMANAPVPKEIKDEPLHNFQYLKQVLVTLEPLKIQLRDYYSNSIRECDSLGLSGEDVDSCKDQYAYTNYLIGNGYDKLSAQILKSTQDVPKSLSATEKEELLFQLEDIVFELQDKAMFAYEDGLSSVKKIKMESSHWYSKILESLARLSPDKYGSSFYVSKTTISNDRWIVRADSALDWNNENVPKDGWHEASVLKADNVIIGSESVPVIWGDKNDRSGYFWKHIFVDGIPRSGAVYVATEGKYRLFVNGSLTLSDTVGNRSFSKVDSVSGITSLVKSGDNVIAVAVEYGDSVSSGVAIMFSAMVDTTKHFESSAKLPEIVAEIEKKEQKESAEAKAAVEKEKLATSNSLLKSGNANGLQFKSSREVLNAIDSYRVKEEKAVQEIKKERIEIQKLRIRNEDLDSKLKLYKEEAAKPKVGPEDASKVNRGALKNVF